MADVEMSDSGHSPAGGIHPSAVIADALRTPPNASTLGALSSIEPFRPPAGLQVDFLVALDRHASWLAALRLRALAAVAGDEPTEEFIEDPFMVVDPVREEISTALRISNFAADKSISLARSLRSKLLATEEKLATGRSPSPTRRLSPKSASGFQHPRQHRSSRSYFWARARKRRVNCVVMPGELLRELPRCQSLTKRKPSSPNARFGCSTTEASWPRSKPCCQPRMPLLSGMP